MSKILIVDDNDMILKVVSRTLEGEGYEAITAESGKKALEILKREKPDMILMDVMMPEMDGWETIEKIKADTSNKGILVAMLTVKSSERDKDKSMGELGVDWHFSKPISNKELLRTIGMLLKMRENN